MKRGVRLIIGSLLVVFVLSAGVNGQPQPPKVIADVPDNATNFVEGGNSAYFTVGDALWGTDGTTEGTLQLRVGLTNPEKLTWGKQYARSYREYFYFVDKGETELWRSDGTPGGTILLQSASSIRLLDVTEGYLYFRASTTSTGVELYRTEGTVAGTSMVMDIGPGSMSGFDVEAGYASTGFEFYFAGNDGTHGREVWVSAPDRTYMVKDINEGPGDGFSLATNTFAFNDKFYFAVEEEGYLYPWISNGTEEGTARLGDPAPDLAYDTPYIEYMTYLNDDVYFITRPWQYDGEVNLWKSGGTPETTGFVKMLAGEHSYNVYHSFVRYKNKLYFWDRADRVTDFLWVTDGTSGGTNTFFNIITVDGAITFFDVIGDYLVFTGDAEAIPFDLYHSDGTTAGTKVMAKIKARTYMIFPRDFTKAYNFLYYADHDGLTEPMSGSPHAAEDSYHLFQADGETSKSMRTLFGISTIDTDNITLLRGAIVFTAKHEGQKKLWFYSPPTTPIPEVPKFMLVQAASDDDVRRIIDDALIVNRNREPLTVRFDPAETPGSVVFEVNGSRVRVENSAPFSLAGDTNGDYNAWPQGTVPGTYVLTATPYSEANGQGVAGESLTVTFRISRDNNPPPTECTASGNILREYWANAPGTTVPAIPVYKTPTSTSQLTLFEGPSNVGSNYGSRISGYICPPTTGNYTFWIASNDHSELWLSTDDSPANKVRIANLTRATNPREWNKFPSQKSEPIALVAGKRYYIEALHKEGVGDDHIAVGWRLPDGTMERPIAGSRLSPFDKSNNQPPIVTVLSPNDGDRYQAPGAVDFSVDGSDPDGTISHVEYIINGELAAEVHRVPHSFTRTQIPEGTYTLVVRVTDDRAASTTSEEITYVVGPPGCDNAGTILREFWTGVQGARVSDIPVASAPHGAEELSTFSTPSMGTNYGSRFRGYICPPVSGNYVFWVSSNDHSELWLSNSEDPGSAQRIAWVTGATTPDQWTKFASQRSNAIHLEAGQLYYVEALHKQGIGTDHFTVAWSVPGGSFEAPIPGTHLVPFDPASTADARLSGTAALEQVSIYPNPASSDQRELRIAGYEGIDERIATDVEIINLNGDVVYAEKVTCGGDCSSYLLNINKQLVPGIYLVNLKAKGARFSKRLIVK